MYSGGYSGAQVIANIVSLTCNYSIDQGQFLGLYAATLVLAGVVNTFSESLLCALCYISVIWHIVGTLIIVIWMTSVAPTLQSPSFVLTNFTNETNFSSSSYVGLIGLLFAASTFTGYDTAAHVAEETTQSHTSSKNDIYQLSIVLLKLLLSSIKSSWCFNSCYYFYKFHFLYVRFHIINFNCSAHRNASVNCELSGVGSHSNIGDEYVHSRSGFSDRHGRRRRRKSAGGLYHPLAAAGGHRTDHLLPRHSIRWHRVQQLCQPDLSQQNGQNISTIRFWFLHLFLTFEHFLNSNCLTFFCNLIIANLISHFKTHLCCRFFLSRETARFPSRASSTIWARRSAARFVPSGWWCSSPSCWVCRDTGTTRCLARFSRSLPRACTPPTWSPSYSALPWPETPSYPLNFR